METPSTRVRRLNNPALCDLAGLELTPQAFGQIQLFCDHDPKFPKSWAEWQGLIDRAATVCADEEHDAGTVQLVPSAFAGWCAKVGIMPDIDALRAYAVTMRCIRP